MVILVIDVASVRAIKPECHAPISAYSHQLLITAGGVTCYVTRVKLTASPNDKYEGDFGTHIDHVLPNTNLHVDPVKVGAMRLKKLVNIQIDIKDN